MSSLPFSLRPSFLLLPLPTSSLILIPFPLSSPPHLLVLFPLFLSSSLSLFPFPSQLLASFLPPLPSLPPSLYPSLPSCPSLPPSPPVPPSLPPSLHTDVFALSCIVEGRELSRPHPLGVASSHPSVVHDRATSMKCALLM